MGQAHYFQRVCISQAKSDLQFEHWALRDDFAGFCHWIWSNSGLGPLNFTGLSMSFPIREIYRPCFQKDMCIAGSTCALFWFEMVWKGTRPSHRISRGQPGARKVPAPGDHQRWDPHETCFLMFWFKEHGLTCLFHLIYIQLHDKCKPWRKGLRASKKQTADRAAEWGFGR